MKRRLFLLAIFLILFSNLLNISQSLNSEKFIPGFLAKTNEICPMRIGPSDEFPILLYPPGYGEIWLQKGEKIGIIEVRKDWLYIKHNYVLGFVKKELFSPLDIKFDIHSSLTIKFYFQADERNENRFSFLNKCIKYLGMSKHFQPKEKDKIKIDAIIISLKNQEVGGYNKEGKLLVRGYCVIGKTGRETRQGNWEIYTKQSPRYLSGPGYDLPVTYWMPFYGGQGLHDAYWRTFLGPWEDHKKYGSRGCVNLTYPLAEFLYFHTYIGTKVIVEE